jgi:CheY-like chemotaxis protein
MRTPFHLHLPAQPSEAPFPAIPGRGEHLLYVDDEETLVCLASLVLARMGYQVTGYTDPQVALQALSVQTHEFDCLVTDLSMPGMSGFELAQQALAMRADLPILMVSGYVRPEDEATARRIGIRDIVRKPNALEELGVALERVLRPKSV